MSLTQFLRILWARKLLILGTALFCLAGGLTAIMIVPPRWKAQADVYLNLIKPDPVTGEVLGMAARSYVATQVKLISDYTVAGLAVDKLGWLSDPTFIQQYQRRSQSNNIDFRRWLAQIVSSQTDAGIPDGSNIMAITYTGSNPEAAKAIVNAVREAYLDVTVSFKRGDANKNADWFAQQAVQLKNELIAAQTAMANFERENDIVMQDDRTDIDSARLTALATQADGAAGGGSLEAQVAGVDAQIRQAQETLGPNHPQLQSLRAQRASLASLMSQGATRSSGSSSSSRVAAAKAAVMGNRDKLARMRILQSDVALRQEQYNKAIGREAEFRQQAGIVDAGVTALGAAYVPQTPSYPNKPLIVGGSLGLGLAFGILIALLTELLDRRVRSPEDLTAALGLPVLAVIRLPS
jgi:uncharacterized protein involved in exopolysaccharide biosynthesis